MSSFQNLKRGSDFEKLKKQIETINQPQGDKDDDRFWVPVVDKSGNGMATIRFLPTPPADGDDGLPWVRLFRHAFQGPGGWLIDECLTTLGGNCPVCENNTVLWNTGSEANKEIVRKRKRKLYYIANVYIISDPACPENDGQVKLFKFGKKIFDKLNEAMNPQFADETPINPFDLWAGANFKLKMRQVEGYRNYDKSEFEKAAPLDTDENMEAIWLKEYSLKEFLDPKKFNTYEKIKARQDKILGVTGSPANNTAEDSPYPQESQSTPSEKIGDDDDMNYFKSLAAEDDVPF